MLSNVSDNFAKLPQATEIAAQQSREERAGEIRADLRGRIHSTAEILHRSVVAVEYQTFSDRNGTNLVGNRCERYGKKGLAGKVN